jgi:hypothetical protein
VPGASLKRSSTVFCPQVRILLVGLTMAVLLGCSGSLSGQENARPWTRHTIDDSSRGADGVRLADVNGDGLMDIATPWEEGGCVRACINPGPSRVNEKWPAVTVGEVGSPEDAVFVDLDDDGAIDVVSCCEGNVRTMWVHWAPREKDKYLQASSWKTEAIPVTQGARSWMFCVPMQVDGKDGVDLVAGAKGQDAQIGWLESPKNPRDLSGWKWHGLYEAGWIMSLFAVDMDADGDLDVLASDRKGPNRGCLWLENPGNAAAPGASWKEHRIGGGEKEVMFIVAVDLDRDGLLDVLAALMGHEMTYHRRKSRDGLAWESLVIQLSRRAGNGKGINVGDINLDRKPDVVFTCEHASGKAGVMWMSSGEAVTHPIWEAHDISGLEGIKFDLVQLLDLDADGDLDVITCEEQSNLGVVWYENPTR